MKEGVLVEHSGAISNHDFPGVWNEKTAQVLQSDFYGHVDDTKDHGRAHAGRREQSWSQNSTSSFSERETETTTPLVRPGLDYILCEIGFSST